MASDVIYVYIVTDPIARFPGDNNKVVDHSPSTYINFSR